MPLSKLAAALMASDAMKDALTVAVPAIWPENARYCAASQAEAVGAVLTKSVHRHLRTQSIGYLFRPSMVSGDKIVLAKASKAGARLTFYTGYTFCIDVNWEAWRVMPPEGRAALVDHELCHFGVEETESGDRLLLLHHDLEEFSAIVARWGFWKGDVESFAKVCAAQRDLFQGSP